MMALAPPVSSQHHAAYNMPTILSALYARLSFLGLLWYRFCPSVRPSAPYMSPVENKQTAQQSLEVSRPHRLSEDHSEKAIS